MRSFKATDILASYSECVIATMLLLAFTGIFIWCGFNSVDFGAHWDEGKLIGSVIDTANTGVILPRWYNYPSLSYLVCLFTALFGYVAQVMINPDIIFPPIDKEGIVIINKQFIDFVNTQTYHFEVRSVFILLTASSALVVSLSARLLGVNWIASATTGITLLLSYPIFYHSRWIAPDTLLMLMTALVILTTVWASKHNSSQTLTFAAISAGLAAAAKYPGGITLFLPLYVAIKGKHKFQRLGIIMTFFMLTFLFITPGILLEPVEFIKNVRGEMNHYKTGHAAHTLETKLDGIQKLSEFILFRLFSPDAAISVGVILLAVMGAVFIWQRNKNHASIILIPIIAYLVYFSTQKVLFVRNLLMLTPFIVVLVGIAIDALMKYFPGNVLRFAIPVAFLALLSSNLNYYFKAVDSLQNPRQDAWGMALEQYLDKNPTKKISISDKALDYVSERYKSTHSAFVARESADIYIFTLKEELWICANRRNSFRVLAGPDDTDLDYYPEWVGYNRVVALDQQVCH
ncbi:hypothetical protein [Methylomonas sp. AM2-LC]|uniref:hypothetical protein n=1 Tax=Methylomonas sp. AM2-LC TaxID=3153301 RepID=UPI003264A3B2